MPRAPIACPNPIDGKLHALKTNAVVKPLGLLRCTHRASARQGECGARVIVLALGGGWHYVAVVTAAEIRAIESMSGDATMAYLLTGNGSTTSLPLDGT